MGFFTLLSGLPEKLILYVVMGIVIIALFVGGYLVISHNAKHEQALIDQQKVLQTVIDNQNKFIEEQKSIIQLNNESTNQLTESLNEIQKKTSELTEFLASPGAIASDRPSSDILKQTIERLRGNQ